jgi:hypothetical protein
MIDFEEFLFSHSVKEDQYNVTDEGKLVVPKGREIGLGDICMQTNITSFLEDLDEEEDDCEEDVPFDCPVKLEKKCQHSPWPLDFIYERHNDTYNLTRYETDRELLKKVRSGKGDPFLYRGFRRLFIQFMFKGTTPDKVD